MVVRPSPTHLHRIAADDAYATNENKTQAKRRERTNNAHRNTPREQKEEAEAEKDEEAAAKADGRIGALRRNRFFLPILRDFW